MTAVNDINYYEKELKMAETFFFLLRKVYNIWKNKLSLTFINYILYKFLQNIYFYYMGSIPMYIKYYHIYMCMQNKLFNWFMDVCITVLWLGNLVWDISEINWLVFFYSIIKMENWFCIVLNIKNLYKTFSLSIISAFYKKIPILRYLMIC